MNKTLTQILKDIKTHFKRDKWPLNYNVYLDLYPEVTSVQFSKMLIKNKYTIYVNEKNNALFFEPVSKQNKKKK